MKAVFMMWLLSPLLCLCQDTLQPKSKIETYAIKMAAIVKKQTNHIYDYQGVYNRFNFKAPYGTGNLSCDLLTIEDVASGTVVKGLDLSTHTYSSATYTGYIDGNEVPALIKFFDYLTVSHKYRQPEGTEYTFTCNDVRFTCFNTRDNRNEIAWLCKVNVNTRFEKAVAYLDIHELNYFSQRLKEVVDKLN